MLARIEKELAAYFMGKAEVTAAFIFGSVARGDDRPDSDVDIAILVTHDASKHATTRSQFVTDLMHLCRRPNVDAVIINDAPPVLQHRVVRDGHVVFCRDSTALAEFTIRAIQRYEDTRPLRMLQRQRLRQELASVPTDGVQTPSSQGGGDVEPLGDSRGARLQGSGRP